MSPPAIVILTGAGISKESGLDTFRDADGIWARVRIEDVATPEARAAGACTMGLNVEPSSGVGLFDEARQGLPASSFPRS
jgi:hypothetical protein